MLQGTGIREKVLEEICALAEKYRLDRVILFGSRARGDYKKTSDISLDVEEETSTLLFYDVVNLDKPVMEELLESIEKEGKVLYEKV